MAEELKKPTIVAREREADRDGDREREREEGGRDEAKGLPWAHAYLSIYKWLRYAARKEASVRRAPREREASVRK